MSAAPLQVGDVVRYRKPFPDESPSSRFVVTESNGDRGFMQILGSGLSIVPITLYRLEDVVVVPAMTPIRGPVEIFGRQFVECDTGGGCMALCHDAADGTQILITGYNEAYLPTCTDWSIGFYDVDHQQYRLAAGDGTNEPVSC